MTSILLQRSKDPTTCMACGRMAIGLGVHEPNKPVHAWICSPAHHHITRTLISMKANELNACEKRAVKAATSAVIEPILNEVMGAMWDAGVRDLSAATPEQVTAALAALGAPMSGHVESALVAFGDAVKADLKDGACPF